MVATRSQPAAPKAQNRWFCATPGRAMVALLGVDSLLVVSRCFRCFPFHEHKGYTVLIAVAGTGVFFVVMSLWFLTAALFRIRLQSRMFSLVVLAPLVVAIPCSWLAVEIKLAREQKAAVEQIRRLDGEVMYDWEVTVFGSLVCPASRAPLWLRALLGEDFFADVAYVVLHAIKEPNAVLEQLDGFTELQAFSATASPVSDAGLEHLAGLTRLRMFEISNIRITDAELRHLRRCTELQYLYLVGTDVSDAGLEHVAGLTQLKTLILGYNQITDAGLEHLKGLNELQELDLAHERVSDTGVSYLRALRQLKRLNLDDTQVTPEGVNELRQALPRCKIAGHEGRESLIRPPDERHRPQRPAPGRDLPRQRRHHQHVGPRAHPGQRPRQRLRPRAVLLLSAGRAVQVTDQNQTVHALAYDGLGRQVGDAVTLPTGSEIDDAVLRTERSYNAGLRTRTARRASWTSTAWAAKSPTA